MVNPSGIAGLRQQLHGPLRVIGVVVRQILHENTSGRPGTCWSRWGCRTRQRQIDDLLLVHGIAQGLPDLLVLKGSTALFRYRACTRFMVPSRIWKSSPSWAAWVVVRWGEQVDGPALEAHHQAVRILDDAEGHLVQLRRGAPVIGEPLQDDGVLSRPGDELEGPRAHGGGVLPVVVRRQDGQRQIGEEFTVRLGQRDGQRGLNRLDVRDRRKRRDQGRAL